MSSRAVSPPPSKRRRLTETAASEDLQIWRQRTIEVYSWNVNGITPFIQQPITSFFSKSDDVLPAAGPSKASLRDFLKRHEWPTMLFLQEVKINPDDASTMRCVERAIQPAKSETGDSPEYIARFCLPSDKHNARGFGRKVYGVCSIIRQDYYSRFVESVREVDWDVEGRFLVIETRAIDKVPKLAIFNVYAVNGTDHPYRDPSTGNVVGTRHDRKLQVHRLLQAECRRLQAEGFGIIVAGDLNIARSRIDAHPNLRTYPPQHCLNRADFEMRFFSKSSDSDQIANDPGTSKDSAIDRSDSGADRGGGVDGLGMIDTFRHLHADKRRYTYYPRSKTFGDSCDRVDMILTSRDLADVLVEAGMHETPSERGPSDHVPLFAKFDFSQTDARNDAPSFSGA